MYDAIGKSNEEMGEGFWTVEDMKNNNHSAYGEQMPKHLAILP